ncbi:hypothetical protein [Chitinophaga pinensis]|uniref:Uncharacterized protein n=1 Tax=Chitinophaga pinensis TaxID=79329 RepID=A0A5C6LTX7_9BACT|nr:hypothetical protein [Chitinophaga pinensis]TWV99238.1 hypothetical protein FEF09_17210 [Chitinophaga pinensis]
MLKNVPVKMLGRYTLLYACLIGPPAIAQDMALLSSATHASSDRTSGQRQMQTLGQILQDIEKKHAVSFLCRSELLQLQINKEKKRFGRKASRGYYSH